jgi:hypothetical protein
MRSSPEKTWEIIAHRSPLFALSPDQALEAETWLVRSLKIAQKRQLPMLELRAANRLCRLWQQETPFTNPGIAEQGRQLLSSVYEKFTEGFTTADLVEAGDLRIRL